MERLDEFGRSGNSTGSLSTAGAVAIKNAKGVMTMQKVKVTRYVAGQRPAFAESDSDSEDERRRRRRERQSHKKVQREDIKEMFEQPEPVSHKERGSRHDDIDEVKQEPIELDDRRARNEEKNDRRLQRLNKHREDKDDSSRRRSSPSVVSRNDERRRRDSSSSSGSSTSDGEDEEKPSTTGAPKAPHRPAASDDSDVDDETVAARRAAIRERRMAKEEKELLAKEELKAESGSGEESTSDEEDTSSDDDTAPKLRPVFVRKRDRITLQESEKERRRLEEMQLEDKRSAEARKKDSHKMVENIVKRDMEYESRVKTDTYDLASIDTDDEQEEIAYDQWKVRELTRIKRVKDEGEVRLKERAEIERVHNMTDEERKEYVRLNPKIITNKQEKGKYKFMQKYFHRGVFYLDEDDEVYKRDFAEPTLEDRFDKSVLPKVMQVKDFGKQGRTKWTHLVQEDTTDYTNAWAADSASNLKFYKEHGGGLSESMVRPAAKKQRTT